MRKLAKILFPSFVAVAVLLAIAINFTIGWRPFLGPRARPVSDRQFERTPQRLARGRYLTTAVAGCETCHSPKDWKTHGAPILPGMEMAGQVIPLAELPGRIVAPNLSPDAETGAGNWSDEELARAIREGIGHDGRALFAMMPYGEFRNLSDEDVASIVVYLRSLPAVHNPLPPTQVSFPVNYLIRGAPEPVMKPVHGPDEANPAQRAAYLVTVGCGCHTPSDPHGPLPGMQFAGEDGPSRLVADYRG